jgi:hypothetical protein
VTRKSKTSNDGGAKGPLVDTPDEIQDAEVVGEDGRVPSPENDAPATATDDTASGDVDGPVKVLTPAEDMAPEAAAEIGTGGDRRSSGEEYPSRTEDEAVPVDAEQAADATAPHDPPESARAEAETVRNSETPPLPPPRRRGAASLVAALLFGGVLAALAGVAAARFLFPDGWPGQGDTAATLAELRADGEAQMARIAEMEAAIAALDDRIAALPDPVAAVEDVRANLSGQIDAAAGSASEAAARLEPLEQGLSTLESRVTELAQRPVPEALDTASLDAELAAFRQELSAAVEAARDEIVRAQEEAAAIAAEAEAEAAAREQTAAEEAEALRAEAEAAAATAAREAAISRVRAAIENGEPFAEDLAALDGMNVPAALSAAAEEGVPSLAALVEGYPPAARAALDASIRATMGEGALDRVSAFLRVQTGARSLEPRPGDDPDAVLSRAEAALRAGELESALSELAALPDAGQAAMAGWMDAARTRHEAVEAARALTPN